jgi:hypothetical protein
MAFMAAAEVFAATARRTTARVTKPTSAGMSASVSTVVSR